MHNDFLDHASAADGETPAELERCPICGRTASKGLCRHVRWSFDQGGPVEFGRFALESSPYVRGRGHRPGDIPESWWLIYGDWIIDQIGYRLRIGDAHVFGELADLDALARDIWKKFQPDHLPAYMRQQYS
jgi:hypothetical protein